MWAAVCLVWLLSTGCANDWAEWPESSTHPWTRLVYGGDTYTFSPGVTRHPVGCFEGSIRFTRLNEAWQETPPEFHPWAANPGRFMEVNCVAGDCTFPACEGDEVYP